MKKSSRLFYVVAALLLLSFSLIAQTTTATELKNIRFLRAGQQAEFIIDCTKPVTHESFTLLNPNRLVVDLTKIETISMATQLVVNDAGIDKIVVGQYNFETARLVFHYTAGILSHRIEETEVGLKVVMIASPSQTPVQAIEIKEIAPAEEKTEPTVTRPTQRVEDKAPARRTNSERELKDMILGFGAGMYTYQDEDFQSIYDTNAMTYRAEMAFRLPFSVDSFDLWASMATYSDTGQTTLFAEEVSLGITTFSIGLRYLKKFGNFVPYVGAGVDYVSYKETYPEGFAVPSVGGNEVGFHGQLGVYYHVIENFSVKVGLKYNSVKALENDIEVNLGGIEYGFSLNWHFNL